MPGMRINAFTIWRTGYIRDGAAAVTTVLRAQTVHPESSGAPSGLTSCEVSIRELARAAGCQRQAGECVRLIDVPVAVVGVDHIFDRAGAAVRTRQWSTAALGDIIEAVATNMEPLSGGMFENIIEDRAILHEVLNRHIGHFCRAVRDNRDSNLARDVAETFGVADAAGRFSILWNRFLGPKATCSTRCAWSIDARASVTRRPN